MPPTWTIISYFYISYEVNLFALTIIGAMSSSFGRFLLARFSRRIVPSIFSPDATSNLDYIGRRMNKGPFSVFSVSFLWALSPLPSNTLFLAVGFARAKVRYALSGFYVGRLISYYSLAYSSKIVYKSLEQILVGGVLNWQGLLVTSAGFILLVLYLALDWERLFVSRRFKFNFSIFKRK